VDNPRPRSTLAVEADLDADLAQEDRRPFARALCSACDA
jgi:hypothetical protein